MSLLWKSVSDENQLDNINSLSFSNEVKAVLFFKHSTRCVVSIRTLARFEEEWTKSKHNIAIFLINVLENRKISNLITEKYQITHESPQVLLIKNGVCVHHNSHSAINAEEISNYL